MPFAFFGVLFTVISVLKVRQIMTERPDNLAPMTRNAHPPSQLQAKRGYLFTHETSFFL